MNFESLPKHKILKLQLNQLQVDIAGSWVEPLIERVFHELETHGIKWRPHIWVSNEWFCPDGVPGVAIPFYLLSKKLIEMEKENVGFIEGHTEKSFLKLFRHEVGHAFDNAFKCRDIKSRNLIFGSSKENYKNYYTPIKYSSSFVRHLPLNYAQAHPDEDFAETFAYVLSGAHRGNKNKNKKYLAKIDFVSVLFKKASVSQAKLRNTYKVEKISVDKNTLESYYVERRTALRLGKNFKNFFTCLSKEITPVRAVSYVNKYKKELQKEVSNHVGIYRYQFDSVMGDFEAYLKSENLYVKNASKIKTEIKDLLVYQSLEDKNLNRFYF